MSTEVLALPDALLLGRDDRPQLAAYPGSVGASAAGPLAACRWRCSRRLCVRFAWPAATRHLALQNSGAEPLPDFRGGTG